MKPTSQSLLIAMAASGFFALGCGAADGGESSGPTDAQRQAYEKEVVALKRAQVADYDVRISELQAKYAIGRGETSDLVVPKTAPQLRKNVEAGLGETRQALSSGTVKWTESYDVKATYYETMSLTAGQKLDWYTYPVDANVDPVMVLFQYESLDSGCNVSPTSVPKLTIKAFNDDSDGTQSRINYTVPASGCYALVIYAYSPSQAGTVGLNKDGCDAPPPPVCGGSPPVCWVGQPRCYLSTPGFGPHVPATGTAVRGAPDLDFMTAVSTSGPSDPRLFVFNYSNGSGATNDDISSTNLNSAIDRADFKFVNNYPNTVLLTGYSSGGTATFTGYQR